MLGCNIYSTVAITFGENRRGVFNNRQSTDTGNIGYTRHSSKTNKAKNTTQKTKKMNNTSG
jgi:hypothetical protein